MIVPNLANAFGIFLMRQFITRRAGRTDRGGAGRWRVGIPNRLFQIVAPAVVPAIAALTLFAFVYHWNSYLWPLTVLQGNTDRLSHRHLAVAAAEL